MKLEFRKYRLTNNPQSVTDNCFVVSALDGGKQPVHKVCDLIKEDLAFFAPCHTTDGTFNATLAGLEKDAFNFAGLDVKDGSHILDIGCNIGLISLVCAKLYPQATIHSFDACRWCIACLRQSCLENNIENIIPHHTCVTASSEEYISFSHEHTGPSCFVRSSLTDETLHPYSGYETKNIHIKDVLADKDDIPFMKMDIEGGEWEIFDYLYENDLDFFKKPQKVHIEVHGHAGEEFTKKINKLKSSFSKESCIVH